MPIQTLQLRLEQIKSSNANLYKHLGEQLKAMSQAWQEAVIPTNGQTAFTLSRAYTNNGTTLKVFLNGTLLTAGVHYTETNNTTVTMSEATYDTDYVVFRVEGAGAGTTFVSEHGHVYKEKPTGTIDGVNKVFRIANLPIANTECIFLNGILQAPTDDYSMTGDGQDITFVSAPMSGDKILVNYDVKMG